MMMTSPGSRANSRAILLNRFIEMERFDCQTDIRMFFPTWHFRFPFCFSPTLTYTFKLLNNQCAIPKRREQPMIGSNRFEYMFVTMKVHVYVKCYLSQDLAKTKAKNGTPSMGRDDQWCRGGEEWRQMFLKTFPLFAFWWWQSGLRMVALCVSGGRIALSEFLPFLLCRVSSVSRFFG